MRANPGTRAVAQPRGFPAHLAVEAPAAVACPCWSLGERGAIARSPRWRLSQLFAVVLVTLPWCPLAHFR